MSLRILIALFGLGCSAAFRMNRRAHEKTVSNLSASVGFVANSAGTPQILEEACNIEPFNSRRPACEVQFDVPVACAGETTKCSLLFAFHGGGGNNKKLAKQIGMKIHNGGYKMIGVYPNGAFKNGDKGQGWNTGGVSSIDDKALVLHIVSLLKAKGWQGRRYAYGSSNGGAMSQELGTNGIMGFSGIAPVVTQLVGDPERAGPGPYNWLHPVAGEGEESSCTVPIAVLSLGGTEDSSIPYNGGYDSKVGGILMSFEATNELWAEVNHCTGMREHMKVDAKIAVGRSWRSQDVVADRMTWSCPSHTPSVHYKVNGMGHGGLRQIEGKGYQDIVLEFFKKVDHELDAAGMPIEPELPDSCRHLLG